LFITCINRFGDSTFHMPRGLLQSLCFALATLAVAPLRVSAIPSWAGGNGNASDNSKWSNTSVAPGNSDHVMITTGTVNFDLDTTYGALDFSGGTLTGGKKLTLGTLASSTWSGGTMTFSSGGGAIISTGATLAISGASNDHDFNASAVTNNGIVNWTGGTLRSGNGGAFTNSGTFNDSASNTVNNAYGGTALVFTNANAASYNKTATGTTTFSVPFNNSGNVSVTSGRLQFDGGGTSSGMLAASGTGNDLVISSSYSLTNGAVISGAVRVTGGTFTATDTITAAGLSIEGGSLQGSQTFTGGTVKWTGGDWNASATTTIASSGTLAIGGTSDHDFNGRAVANSGIVNWTGGRLRSGNGSTFTNNATFNDSASGDVNNDLGGTALVFSNAATGVYNKTAAGQTNFYVPFNNSGAVNVNAGTLNLNGGGTLNSGGTLSAASGTNVVFSNSYTLANASSLSGAGNFTVTNGTFTATGTVNVTNFNIAGGHVAGVHTFKGTLGWTAGDFNDSDTTTIDGTGTFGISTTTDHDFNAHVFVNNGTANWTGGRLRSGSGGTFTNNAVFNDTASSDVNNDYGGTALVFTNGTSGTYNKNAAGQTNFYVPFNNSGTVNVAAGTLNLQGGGTLAGGAKINATNGTSVVFNNSYALADSSTLTGAGAFSVTGGTLTANGSIAVGNLTFAGGQLAGTHVLAGNVAWTTSDFSSAGTTTLSNTSTLTISNGNDHDFNGRGVVNNGTTNWTGGRLRSGNGGTFTNNATFNDSASSDINNDYGGTALVFANANGATYNKTAAGQTNVNVPFNNNGAVNVNAGTLNLAGGGTLNGGGALNAATGASVVFSNSYTLADASALTGSGAFNVTGGTLTATGNVNVSNFSLTSGQLAGTQTFTGGLGWSGGDLNTSGTTTIGPTSSFTISNSHTDHDFNARTIVNKGTTNWTGGRLRSGNGGGFTNNGTFIDTASSEVNNDYGGTSVGFTNGNGATYRKTGAGQTTFNTQLVNNGQLDIQAGTLALQAGATFNDGSSMTGTGLLKLVSGVLNANGAMSFSNFQIIGGTVMGNQTFNGATEWTSGDFNSGSSSTNIGGTFTIDGGADHDFSAHTFSNNGTVNWSASAGRIRSGNGGQFVNNGTFNDSASNVWNNDYGNAATQFFNGTTGAYNKTSAGTTAFNGVSFVNAGAINVQAGSLDLNGGGSSPVGAHFSASTGAALRFTGGNFAVADGSGFAGNGSFVIAGGTVSLGTTISASDFQLIGGTLDGVQTFTGGLTWSNGNMNSSGRTTIGNGGSLTISSGNDHDLSAHTIVNNGTVSWTGGRIRSGNGGTITNNGVFNDTAGNFVNNDYGNTVLTFTNNAAGVYNKAGANTSTYLVPFNNNGTINVSDGALNLNAGGTIGNGAAFHGTGQALLSGGTFTATGTIDSTSLVLAGAQIAGTHTLTGSVRWDTGNFNSTGTTTIGNGAMLQTSSAGDHDFSGHAIMNNGTFEWAAGSGRLRAGNGATFVNNGTFNDRASNVVNNDYGNTSLVFTNGPGATYNKLSTGDTNFQVPFVNSGTVNVASGSLLLNANGTFNSGAVFTGTGTTQLKSGTFTVNGLVTTDNLVLAGASLAGTPQFRGVFTFNNGVLASGATTTIAADGVMVMSSTADHDLPGHSLVNNGVINWTGGRIRGGNGASITNNGTFNDLSSNTVNNDYGNAALTFTNSTTGVYSKSGAGTTTFSVPFANLGLLSVSAGSIVFSSTFTNSGGISLSHGATAQFSSPLSFGTSNPLSGTGTINAPAVTAGGLVSPGNSPGTLTLTGNLTLLSTSALLIELGGTAQGSTYDFLNVGGSAVLGGKLNVTFSGGFQSSVLSTDVFTVVSSSSLSGLFTNVPNGQRLFTMDGLGSFQVNYGTGSVFGINNVALSNFQPIPEPSTYALLGSGLAALCFGALRRRRRRRA
jgi:hypothetical protein